MNGRLSIHTGCLLKTVNSVEHDEMEMDMSDDETQQTVPPPVTQPPIPPPNGE